MTSAHTLVRQTDLTNVSCPTVAIVLQFPVSTSHGLCTSIVDFAPHFLTDTAIVCRRLFSTTTRFFGRIITGADSLVCQTDLTHLSCLTIGANVMQLPVSTA
jgi:hypothetical protein